MKKAKSVKSKMTKAVTKKNINAAQVNARRAVADAYAMGRGIMRGVQEGIADVQRLDKSVKNPKKTSAKR